MHQAYGFGVIIIAFLTSSVWVHASPEHADGKIRYGEIHSDVGKRMFRLLEIEEVMQYVEASQMYEYEIVLSDRIYKKIVNEELVLKVAFSGGCECEDAKVLFTLELTSKKNRVSSSQRIDFHYNAQFMRDYLEFNKNDHYFFNKEAE